MEDVLKRLLEAESRAEVLIKEADAERDRLVQEARAEARTMEERFAASLPALRASFLFSECGRTRWQSLQAESNWLGDAGMLFLLAFQGL
ncbi:hypothetical protein [Methylocaldum sp. 14B]|uniref:hypothetical protein n=1 Tax=Methylocaldum sp. 14B TaxID=1912213 RepID=UPI00098A91FB|nr:hypothetical protein [Methylocaldum sp. 14B]